ncbi:MAG TPA: efflux RND transporter periplasmic adaptor subunit [Nitrospirales bacterium]|nr:efflux RND transporter periplasmic adaptor subunit [Nitrospirales bacterium]
MSISLSSTRVFLLTSVFFLIAGCNDQDPTAQTRSVRTVTVERKTVGETVTLTGQIRAQDEVNLAFRIDGRMIERLVNVGDRVEQDQLIARLDSENERNAERSADADLSAAQAAVAQTEASEGRLRQLLSLGSTTRAQYDLALQQFQTAKAQLDAAQARLKIADDRVSYTELHTDSAGMVTGIGAEPGEVVTAGKMIAHLARSGGTDAVFNVPAQLIRDAPKNPTIDVWLADNPDVRATGTVREVSPQADPATHTFPIKIGLSDPPNAMRLGATVVGQIILNPVEAILIPATALTESNGKPAVWLVDTDKHTVALQEIDVLRYDSDAVIVSGGLQNGEIVVTAGVHVLRPGQKVKLLGTSS